MTFKIERGIPMPKTRGRSGISQALRELSLASIGDSVFIPNGHFAPGTLGRVINNVAGPGCLAMRKADGGYRVWKIAERQVGVVTTAARQP